MPFIALYINICSYHVFKIKRKAENVKVHAEKVFQINDKSNEH